MALMTARLMATLLLICAVAPATGFQPLAGALRGFSPVTRAQAGPGARMRPAVGRPLGLSMASSGAVDPEVSKRPLTKLRFIQHKTEAFWFYRYLSIVYDYIVNPGHWTDDMRVAALEPANIGPDMDVVDVGGGTGFCTIGILQAGATASRLVLMDQSPHQLAKARAKDALKGVSIIEGDAEELPFETDSKDRYVSAGSIEYWPEPQRGICESYRILKPGGQACMIGPVLPTNPISRFFADSWMLFPTEAEYLDWFDKAGFEDVKMTRIGPSWYHGVRRHGLIMGCSVTGTKKTAGAAKLEMGPKIEARDENSRPKNTLANIMRLLLGTTAGFYYFLVPVYMFLKHLLILPLSLVWKDAHKKLM
mmetsp:Transcript_55111/g.130800  ORF Transcript_55111/g.130800 Transcript_55111/m.130800 type:complete len:364 (+) Transcript_55111:47-1138(+)